MKYIFLGILSFLALASAVRYFTLPDSASPVPVIYWVTDSNPARQEQVELFHHWLRKNGHVVRDENNNPIWGRNGKLQTTVELRLDTANTDETKRIVQGVSGISGDLVDIGSGRALIYYNQIGLLHDLTGRAKTLEFDPSTTFPAIVPEITQDGRQYSYPCNVAFGMYWVNADTFRKYGQPLPPEMPTIEEFERMGKAFVAAANTPDQRHRVFYANGMNAQHMMRSDGVATFNETLTACVLDDPRAIKAVETYYKWIYEDHLLPSNADRQSMTTASGYGGADLQLFNNGIYAMLSNGRHAVIQFREFNKTRQQRGQPLMDLKVVAPPYFHFPNVGAYTRAAMVYQGSKNKDLAVLFLAYLASEEYNLQVVRDGDSLPPNPKYCLTDAYNRPPEHPEEWGWHEPFYKISEYAIGDDYSPYVVPATTTRAVGRGIDMVLNRRATADQAMKETTRELNSEIRRTLKENPRLKSDFEPMAALQKKIDQRRANGQPVPLSWIKNPFHRVYYQKMGWIEPEPAAAQTR